jgi:hypothetical protein
MTDKHKIRNVLLEVKKWVGVGEWNYILKNYPSYRRQSNAMEILQPKGS